MNTKIIFILIGVLVLSVTIFIMVLPGTTENKLNFTPLDKNGRESLPLDRLPHSDYHNLLNIKFHFTKINFVCGNSSEPPLLLILVHSSSEHFSKRQTIRTTWGAASDIVKIVFLVGQSHEKLVNTQLDMESKQYKDIVQGDFLDTYTNITYKHTMGMKYSIYHCSEAKYILKIDDDIFANIPKLEQFLIEDISPFGAKDVLMCAIIRKARALRSFRSKWRITFDEYPDRYYPQFCRGMAILYSRDVLFNLYRKAQENRKYVKLDDVFYTGITADNIGFNKHSNIDNLIHFMYNEKNEGFTIPDNLKSYLFVGSELKTGDVVKLWQNIQRS